MRDEEQDRRERHHRILRGLRRPDPDRGLPFPPPAIANILAACLFAAAGLAAGFLGVHTALRFGPGFIVFAIAAVVWPVLLAFGAWRARPLTGREVAFRRAFAPVVFQALCFAVGSYFAVMAVSGSGPGGRMAEIIVTGTVLATFVGIASSFVLQNLARRAEALLLAQYTGPFILMIGGALMALFI